MRNVYKLVYIIIGFMLMLGVASAATLNVPTQYKTIQKAVNAAHDGDTINVLAGTYPERVFINDKHLNFIGQSGKYPTVYGFMMGQSTNVLGAANINGFRITKYGIIGGSFGGNTIRNNYFVNCGITGGDTWGNNNFINNQFTNGGIRLYAGSRDNVVTGNTFYKAKIGLELIEGAYCTKISGNTFSNCGIGVKIKAIPSILIGNKYIKNKINIQTGNF